MPSKNIFVFKNNTAPNPLWQGRCLTYARINQAAIIAVTLLCAACSPDPAATATDNKQNAAIASTPAITEYRTIEWTDLLPKEDLDALMHPPESLNDISDGSLEDSIASQIQASANGSDDPYQKALQSTNIVTAFNGQHIRIPGFIVPLEFDAAQNVTRFFIVPYFGACIHVPPPPPNQIIFGSYPQGLALADLSDAFGVQGTLRTTQTENETALAAYAIDIDKIEIYAE